MLNTMVDSASNWVAKPFRNPTAPLRLVCFAGAGGSASQYRLWGQTLGPQVDVCALELPGHWSRRDEPFITRFEPAIEAIGPEVAALADRPYAVFGFSMGSLLAYHTVRWLRRRQKPMPMCLFVAGRGAPEYPSAHGQTNLTALSDAQFVEVMRTVYDGIPQAVLQEPDLLKLALPVLRADMELLDDHNFKPEPPLDIPLHVSGGSSDPHLTPEKLRAWGKHTTNTCDLEMFPGPHHFLEPSRAAVLAYVQRCLRLQP